MKLVKFAIKFIIKCPAIQCNCLNVLSKCENVGFYLKGMSAMKYKQNDKIANILS